MFQSIRNESTPEIVMPTHGVIVGLSTQFIADLPLRKQQMMEFVRGGTVWLERSICLVFRKNFLESSFYFATVYVGKMQTYGQLVGG